MFIIETASTIAVAMAMTMMMIMSKYDYRVCFALTVNVTCCH